MLMYSGKLLYERNGKKLLIQDSNLERELMILNVFLENKEISTIEDLSSLIGAIKKLSEEKMQ